ncbi:16S rRNA (guanine(527)-N(7))-methyltransferase RsmG [Treponema ruminis]|uniref:Ribosomal RNA small subunit methyltransferase G n=1 Tax=Treponema ruminis TaxID=744515 RepID=A0A7W8G744_9SPIR|nr:16S rRNA (guanine(527)-N(7))-methyltransferase RsmG [Treponema ruminis]MBB5224954.1 16S rRNA (guanine527-N7)-methyltransferase [Treponema ruminis]
MNTLHEGLLQLGFEAGEFSGIQILPIDELEAKMEKYISILQEYNAKFDLINTDGHDEIAVRHILDSLSALPKICSIISGRFASLAEDQLSLADIGSGAGLPGIPLASALPQFHFTLIERMTKRCGFLNHCAAELGLKNVTVEENQAERLEQKLFDLCAFRAFRPLEKKMAKVLLRILKDGGCLCAYKAKKANIIEEMEALPQKPKYEIFPLVVPFLTENAGTEEERERNLVVIEK